MRLDQIGTPKPGFYEVHSNQGVTWRSTPRARGYPEASIRPKLAHFREAHRASQNTDNTYSRVYKAGPAWLEITQEHWETIPTVDVIAD